MINARSCRFLLSLLAIFGAAAAARADTVWLDTLEMDRALVPWGGVQRNLSFDRTPLTVGGKSCGKGIGVVAKTRLWVDLGRGAGRFKTDVGVDDASRGAACEFVIVVDDVIAWRSGVMHKGDAPKSCDIDVNGKRYMLLSVEERKGGGCLGDWGNSRWETSWSEPVQAKADTGDKAILTPLAGPAPRLNTAARYGERPGAPFHYTIPCTGQRPILFSAAGLPPGLLLDPSRGWITGSAKSAGTFPVTLTVKNTLGVSTRTMDVVIGDQLALTPPMGWSSWNAWCANPTQARVLSAAQSMVKYDLIDHGFSYVDIDDGWQGLRGGKFNGIQANPEKFPDFGMMLAQVHDLGLKLGVYSGPWICSYCGYAGTTSDDPNGKWTPDLRNLPRTGHTIGKYSLAANDAKEWASWGVDYLKYDWYPNEEAQVDEMDNALRATGRDIVYSVSNSASLQKGPMLAKHAQLWRASGDVRDTWKSLYQNGFSYGAWAKFAGPGHWPDPDMMVLGNVGFGPEGWGDVTHPTELTPDEQYTHMSLWCLLAGPLILGCDLSKLDPFTIGLLTNDEVIAVDQDPLGTPARKVAGDDFYEVWSRPLSDGSLAVGVFNMAPGKFRYALRAGDLKLQGAYAMRDLWRQKDLGAFGDERRFEIPGHGVLLFRLTPQKSVAAITTRNGKVTH